MEKKSGKSVPPGLYDERYFLESCGGVEFYRAYGPKILKPSMAYALRQAKIQPGMRVLDAGCGRGELLYHLQTFGAETHGIDFSEDAIKISQSNAPKAKIYQCSLDRLPFTDGFLDRIFFLGVFEHLYPRQLEKCFKEFWRVLRPEGQILITTCTNRLYYKTWSHPYRLSLAHLAQSVGLPLREPRPARSEEDRRLHINEQHIFSMRRFFQESSWRVRVELLPNFKLLMDDIYDDLPEDFPLRPIRGWRRWVYRKLFFHLPIHWLLARSLFCTAVKEPKA